MPLTIEITLLISIISVSASVFFGLRNSKRNEKADAQRETADAQRAAADTTTIIMKLENIGDDVKEVKGDLRGVKDDVKELRERVVINEQSAKQAHKRIDDHVRQQGG